jgi:hypothetical protein
MEYVKFLLRFPSNCYFFSKRFYNTQSILLGSSAVSQKSPALLPITVPTTVVPSIVASSKIAPDC